MTNEEMQKLMQFILEQQAQFAVNIQKLEGAQARSEKAQTRLEAAQAKSEERISRLEGAIVGVVDLIGALTRAQERTDAKVNELADKVTQLTDAQKQTDERLNALIDMVERYLTDRRNGDAQA